MSKLIYKKGDRVEYDAVLPNTEKRAQGTVTGMYDDNYMVIVEADFDKVEYVHFAETLKEI